ncbi:hypothetical protein BerOc1_03067 [Pseudodesulfovibrio hydrargyri]|uniref:HNH endonuclease n=1 Tax=Pseudodesulfovibrio hydrargyri TaxID=2125990 RepID=A0A1J5MYP4_9BACT|nr:HNH endonuclease signature motif containing protein [Pseudodesulfovibrio hydrargyri]OIQ51122.1 hypothetical protein BerOc1_03067 [Pseudodesulfovibrio hydrargyri]
MKGISILTIKKLYAMSGNECAMPACDTKLFSKAGVFLGEICHINAKNRNGSRFDPNQSDEERNGYDNLLILCPNCHTIIDSREDWYPAEALREIKKIHESNRGRKENDEDMFKAQQILNTSAAVNVSNSSNVVVNSPGAKQTTILQFKTPKKASPSIIPPSDSVANDRLSRSYIKHLIDRYNDFASKNKNRRAKFSYAVIYSSIQKQFGTKWDLLSVNDVEACAEFVQKKIDNTILGKLNKSKGRKNYSSFSEWSEMYPNLKQS